MNMTLSTAAMIRALGVPALRHLIEYHEREAAFARRQAQDTKAMPAANDYERQHRDDAAERCTFRSSCHHMAGLIFKQELEAKTQEQTNG